MQNANTNRNVEKASSIRSGQHHSWSIPTFSTLSAPLILSPPPPLQFNDCNSTSVTKIGEYRFGPSVFCCARTLSIGYCEFCCGLFCLQKVEYFHLTIHCVIVFNVIVGRTQVVLFTRYLVCSSTNPLHVLGDLRSISPRNPNLRKSCLEHRAHVQLDIVSFVAGYFVCRKPLAIMKYSKGNKKTILHNS